MWKIRTIIAFLVTFLICGLIGFFTIQNRYNADKDQLEKLILEQSNRLNDVISKQLNKTQALTALIIRYDGTVDNFQETAAVLANDIPTLANFLLAPDGVVTDVYPLEGNESVIGLDFFNEVGHAGNKEAILARDTGELVMAGPFMLRQGIMGLTGRYPVYSDSETGERVFWGLVSVSLRFPEALEGTGLSTLDNQGISYEIWRINPDTLEEQVIASNGDLHESNTTYLEKVIRMHNAEWYFRIYMPTSWYEYPETWISFLGALSISLFIAFIMQTRNAAVHRAARFREAAEVKSKFFAQVSHEIRTPMNVIIGISDIELDKNTYPADAYDAFSKINNSSKMMLGIINDLLDMSKVETGKFELIPVDYDLSGLIYDAARLNSALIGDKPLEFNVKAAETLPSVLYGDDRRIKQILSNILSNAIKYTNEGNVTLAVDSEQKEDNVTLIFTIKDTGQGLTKEQLSMLYDEYSMFNRKENLKVQGTGLGMSITKKLVELMGGSIDAQSEPGIGTTFTVCIPQVQQGAGQIGKELAAKLNNFKATTCSSEKKQTREYMSHGSVLIVDDVAENLFVSVGLIERYGVKTETVTRGREAIEKIRSGNIYDIIFMDYMMPEMDGVETVKILRAEGYINPVVVLTANAVAGSETMYLESGFNDFLPKPIDIIELENIIKKYIVKKQPDTDPLILQLKENCGLDTDSAIEAFGAMEEIYINTVKITAQLLPGRINKIRTSIIDDVDAFIIEIHGLKSVLKNIGASALSLDAAQLESAAINVEISSMSKIYPEFYDSLVKLSKNLNNVLLQNPDEVAKTSDKSMLMKVIPEAKTATENYDSLLALELLAPYINYSYDPEMDELLKQIVFSLETCDYESAVACLEEMEKTDG